MYIVNCLTELLKSEQEYLQEFDKRLNQPIRSPGDAEEISEELDVSI